MTDYTKETVTTQEGGNTKRDASGYQTAEYLIYFIFGVLEILLAFRFVLKLLGANPVSGFVDFVYNLSAIFVGPFASIFHTSLAQGAETTSVLEPATLIALIVYALVAWGAVVLVRVISGRQQAE